MREVKQIEITGMIETSLSEDEFQKKVYRFLNKRK